MAKKGSKKGSGRTGHGNHQKLGSKKSPMSSYS